MTDGIEVSGVVVSCMPIGEYDKRVVILTSELGKIHAFARGARRTGSKLLAGTEPLTFCRFRLFSGRNAYTLSEVKIVNYFEKLKKDIDRVYFGFYFLELAAYFSRENIAEKELINLIYMALVALETEREEFSPEFIKGIFEWKIFAIEGIMPDISEGRLLGKKVSEAVLHALKYVSATKAEKVFSFVLEEKQMTEFLELADSYRKLNVDIELKSLEMVRKV